VSHVEYQTTTVTVLHSDGMPDPVVPADGEGWTLVNFCVVETVVHRPTGELVCEPGCEPRQVLGPKPARDFYWLWQRPRGGNE
jgi:hypothetical protein